MTGDWTASHRRRCTIYLELSASTRWLELVRHLMDSNVQFTGNDQHSRGDIAVEFRSSKISVTFRLGKIFCTVAVLLMCHDGSSITWQASMGSWKKNSSLDPKSWYKPLLTKQTTARKAFESLFKSINLRPFPPIFNSREQLLSPCFEIWILNPFLSVHYPPDKLFVMQIASSWMWLVLAAM